MCGKRAHQLGNPVRGNAVVIVSEGDDVAARLGDPRVSPAGRTRDRFIEVAKDGRPAHRVVDHVTRPIRRRIVHDDHLVGEITHVLRRKILESVSEHRTPVTGADDDGAIEPRDAISHRQTSSCRSTSYQPLAPHSRILPCRDTTDCSPACAAGVTQESDSFTCRTGSSVQDRGFDTRAGRSLRGSASR